MCGGIGLKIGITLARFIYRYLTGRTEPLGPGRTRFSQWMGKKWVFGRSSSWPSRKMSTFSL